MQEMTYITSDYYINLNVGAKMFLRTCIKKVVTTWPQCPESFPCTDHDITQQPECTHIDESAW